MNEDAMLRESGEGDLERVRQLIDGGMSMKRHEIKQMTPLHWASREGLHAVAELLNSSKCDLNPKDCCGFTPLLMAAELGNRPVVDLLLQRGAQVKCANDWKWTLLHSASLNGWMDLVHSILDRGEADPNVATFCGDTPLMLAAKKAYDDVAALLIRAGADVNRSDAFKDTALHWAAYYGRTQVVQVLLEEKELDLNPQDVRGRTPLHFACYKGHRAVVMQLLAAGADTTIKGNEVETALSEGIKKGRFTLEDIRLFVQHGAFLQECDYVRISQNPVLKEIVLKDVGLCTQSIVNKFHRQSLPALKSISYFARKLPNIDKFKLSARQVDEVENLVRCEIGTNTFCNVVKGHPIALSALCVLSLITCQSGTKRSFSPDLDGSA